MPLDLDTFLTALYTAVDDLYKERLPRLAGRRGAKPRLSDSEVLALSVCAEWGMWDSERAYWRFVRARLRHLFPHATDQSQFNRRRRALYPALASIQRALVERLGVDLERERIIDTKPVPVMHLKRRDHNGLLLAGPAGGRAASAGWCASKREHYYGFKLALSISLAGVVARYELVPAHTHDLEAAAEVLERGCRYWADKGFASRRHQEEWREFEGAEVVAEPYRSSRARWPREYSRSVHRVRQLVEVVNAQLQGQFAIERSRAKTVWGLATRVQAKLTAHTFGVYLNLALGRPALALKDLVA